jgi:hypothetical protein
MPLYIDFKQNEDYKHQKSETTRKIALEYEQCFGYKFVGYKFVRYIFVRYIFGAFRVSLSPVFICSTASNTENALVLHLLRVYVLYLRCRLAADIDCESRCTLEQMHF